MPGRPQTFRATPAAPPNESAANTETVIVTLNGVTAEFPGQQINLTGSVSVTPGAAATAMTLRIRRGGLAGTLVGGAEAESGDIVAAKQSTLTIFANDNGQEPAGGTYVLTIQGTGEGGAATVAGAYLECRCN